MRVPKIVHDFLIRHGFQDGVKVGQPSRYSGIKLSRRGTGECYLTLGSCKTLAQFLLHRKFR